MSKVEELCQQTPGITWRDQEICLIDNAALRNDGGGIDHLVRIAVFGATDAERDSARRVIRHLSQQLGIVPASIHAFYMARGRGVAKGATTPAINVRMMAYDTARAIFRAALAADAGAFIFEIARSEIGYTAQRPAEYATVILAAAIKEGYQGPIFLQGDHFQINPRKYASDPAGELAAVETLILEAIAAGFYNIDIDTSTLVDAELADVEAQQALNAEISARLTFFIRHHQPEKVVISIGGEIGEVGKTNSTAEELRAYMNGYNTELAERGGAIGLAKISIQTGTSHGGVVLPDGSLAQVAIDFDCLRDLGEVARNEYGLGGAVQHGASTLPSECFDAFSKADAVEVHLATDFQNIVFDAPELPTELRQAVATYVVRECASERATGDTDEQFQYKLRKKAIGPFKQRFWDLPTAVRDAISKRLEARFHMLFDKLSIAGTRKLVREITPQIAVLQRVGVVAAPDDDTLDD
jgi:fructose/tagatose bisphosphate aldolase